MSTRIIRALIVDDEPLARERIRTLLVPESDIEVVDECSDAPMAMKAVKAFRPDLVFLDVMMPGLNGVELAQVISEEYSPALVFITAHAAFAVDAFELHAVDYLLKPFDRERFQQTLVRARKRLADPVSLHDLRRELVELLKDDVSKEPKTPSYPLRLSIPSEQGMIFLDVQRIDWVAAAENYVVIHAEGQQYMLRETMKNIEESFDPNLFARIHRSRIVRISKIRELRELYNGDCTLVLQGGETLKMSRRYRDNLLPRLQR